MAGTIVQSLIKSNPVVVFSKTVCPYCVNVKKLFDSIGAKYAVVGVDGEGKLLYIIFL